MASQDRVKELLEEVSIVYPDMAIRKLEKGSIVRKSMGLFYEIDDPHIYTEICPNNGDFPYNQIHNAFESNQNKILNLFNGASIIPFSKAVRARVGECVEKGILSQLYSQIQTPDAFLVPGILYNGEEDSPNPHAFNVFFATNDKIKGKPFLIDTENPFAKSELIIHPYIAEVKSIERGEFAVPEEWKCGRIYTMSRQVDLI